MISSKKLLWNLSVILSMILLSLVFYYIHDFACYFAYEFTCDKLIILCSSIYGYFAISPMILIYSICTNLNVRFKQRLDLQWQGFSFEYSSQPSDILVVKWQALVFAIVHINIIRLWWMLRDNYLFTAIIHFSWNLILWRHKISTNWNYNGFIFYWYTFYY